MVLLGIGTKTHAIYVGLQFCPSGNQLLCKRSARSMYKIFFIGSSRSAGV